MTREEGEGFKLNDDDKTKQENKPKRRKSKADVFDLVGIFPPNPTGKKGLRVKWCIKP